MRTYVLTLSEKEALALYNLLAELHYWEGLPETADRIRLRLKTLLSPYTTPTTWSGGLALRKEAANRPLPSAGAKKQNVSG